MVLNYNLLRRTSAFSLVASIVLGICLYGIKHQVMHVEKELKSLRHKNQDLSESIHVLKAEWGFLNNPKRLQELNEKYVHLKPLKTYQIASLDSLHDAKGPLMLARLEKK